MEHEEDAREGNLGQITDEQWLTGHKYLQSLGAVPEEETAYLYDPDRDPETVSVRDLSVTPDPAEPGAGEQP